MSFFLEIHTALDTRLNTLTGGTPIAWENTAYVPIRGTAYLRPTLLMSPSSLMDLDTLQMNQGFYQVDLFYPLGDGAGVLLSKADDIYDHFKGALKLTSGSVNVYIKEISRTAPAEIDNAWYMASIEVHWKAYTN